MHNASPDLLFVSNLFPDKRENYRGLDNSIILHGLAEDFRVRVISPRPALLPKRYEPRDCDAALSPLHLATPYVPRAGSLFNHRLMAARIRPALNRVHAERPAGVLLCSWLFPDGWAAAQWTRRAGVPLVLITQGTDTHTYLNDARRRKAILEACAVSRRVICRSKDLARRLGEAGVAREKLVTIYNGIDPAVFHPGDQGEARRAAGLPETGRIVLFVGNLREVKNPLLLVRSFARVSGDQDLLVMAGQGEMKAEIEAEAALLGISARLRLTGPQQSPEIARLMRASDLLCISSRLEGLPNVLLEALACGLPVVSTRVGGISEVLLTPQCGELVEAGDAEALSAGLEKALRENYDRAAIAGYGARFSWEAAIRSYREVLHDVLQADGQPA